MKAVREDNVDKVFERSNQLQQIPELLKLLPTDKMIKKVHPAEPNSHSKQSDTIYTTRNAKTL